MPSGAEYGGEPRRDEPPCPRCGAACIDWRNADDRAAGVLAWWCPDCRRFWQEAQSQGDDKRPLAPSDDEAGSAAKKRTIRARLKRRQSACHPDECSRGAAQLGLLRLCARVLGKPRLAEVLGLQLDALAVLPEVV